MEPADMPGADELMEFEGDLQRTESSVEGVAESESSLDVLTNSEPPVDPIAAPYVGRWWQLESQTNWEKGKIIMQWRAAVGDRIHPKKLDSTWASQVGGVTTGHVTRLRRVFQRFGDSHATYRGLYWSHFLAALDWHDAPLWLEGAVRSRWTVSEMREMRLRAQEPSREGDGEVSLQRVGVESGEPAQGGGRSRPYEEGEEPRRVAEAVGDYEPPFESNNESAEDAVWSSANSLSDAETRPVVAAFAGLPDLPADVSEALEMFKLAILRHKAAGWQAVRMSDLLRVLDGLRALCESPAE